MKLNTTVGMRAVGIDGIGATSWGAQPEAKLDDSLALYWVMTVDSSTGNARALPLACTKVPSSLSSSTSIVRVSRPLPHILYHINNIKFIATK
jgi:hypothetical protein